MADVSIRDLRNHGGDVVDRAARGEHLRITRSGKPVAELRPLGKEPATLEVLIEARRHLPHVDPVALVADVASLVDPAL